MPLPRTLTLTLTLTLTQTLPRTRTRTLFPLQVKRVIYIDSDQLVRADVGELADLDLQGAPVAMTPFCTADPNEVSK